MDINNFFWLWFFGIVFLWLVVEPTHLKNTRQIGSFPQVGVNITNIWNHHLVLFEVIILLDFGFTLNSCTYSNCCNCCNGCNLSRFPQLQIYFYTLCPNIWIVPAHVGLPGSNVITSKSWKGLEVSIIPQLGRCCCWAFLVAFGGNGRVI